MRENGRMTGKKPVLTYTADGECYNAEVVTTNMLDTELIGKPPNPAEIERLIELKKLDLERLVRNIEKRGQRADEQLKELGDDTDEQFVKKLEDPTRFIDLPKHEQESILEKNRQKSVQILGERRMHSKIEKSLQKETKRSFKDVPDEIKTFGLIKCTSSMHVLSWKAPSSNGSTIVSYQIYSSLQKSGQYEQIQVIDGNKLTADIPFTADRDKIYYLITASSQIGEGYKSNTPLIVISKKSEDGMQLYVWGSNTASELGLAEQMVSSETEYHQSEDKAYLSAPLLHPTFKSMVHSVGTGTSSTLVHCIDPTTDKDILVHMGLIKVLKEEHEEKMATQTLFCEE